MESETGSVRRGCCLQGTSQMRMAGGYPTDNHLAILLRSLLQNLLHQLGASGLTLPTAAMLSQPLCQV